jgi:hypothetical protein
MAVIILIIDYLYNLSIRNRDFKPIIVLQDIKPNLWKKRHIRGNYYRIKEVI